MKVTKTGWVPRSVKLRSCIREYKEWSGDDMSEISLDCVFGDKGKKESWNKGDWPPWKVRITIEEVERG